MVWCDNCLLLFPIASGAALLSALICLYSAAGGIFLFVRGEFVYFGSAYYEPDAYGGVSMAIAFVALVAAIAHSQSSLLWLRVISGIQPVTLLLAVIRAGAMIARMKYTEADITWECTHGGQPYNATLANWTDLPAYNGTTIPTAFCSYGLNTVELAFALALVADCVLQFYAYFLVWRHKAKLLEYFKLSQASSFAGVYTP